MRCIKDYLTLTSAPGGSTTTNIAYKKSRGLKVDPILWRPRGLYIYTLYPAWYSWHVSLRQHVKPKGGVPNQIPCLRNTRFKISDGIAVFSENIISKIHWVTQEDSFYTVLTSKVQNNIRFCGIPTMLKFVKATYWWNPGQVIRSLWLLWSIIIP